VTVVPPPAARPTILRRGTAPARTSSISTSTPTASPVPRDVELADDDFVRLPPKRSKTHLPESALRLLKERIKNGKLAKQNGFNRVTVRAQKGVRPTATPDDVSALAAACASGAISPEQRATLGRAQDLLSAITALGEGGALRDVSPDVRGRLEKLVDDLVIVTGAALVDKERATSALSTSQAVHAKARSKAKNKAVLDHAHAPLPARHIECHAAGAETESAIAVRGRKASGAVFTDRGVDYKNYNEDAGIVLRVVDPEGREVIGAGAFDQAGGMGSFGNTPGAASSICALAFEQAGVEVAEGGDLEWSLRTALQRAHDGIVEAKGQSRAVTTFCAGFVRGNQAVIANVGDSGAVLFDADGNVVAQTTAHNMADKYYAEDKDPNGWLGFANQLTQAVGDRDRPGLPEIVTWTIPPGGRIVFGSDGLFDANLAKHKQALVNDAPLDSWHGDHTLRAIGDIVRRFRGALDATNELVAYARAQMSCGAGKKDNTTIVVIDPGV
jgi:serine/threonine protein phosphatase PrpC